MIHDQLHRDDRIHLRRIAAHHGNRIAQPRQIDQRRLAQNIVANHASRKPGKV
jgi:hypothetical protein